ncbi:MAG: HD domain-containing protein [Candidatus Magasanikbacteria bacterium]|nr:HD domain-containing protein [Candidatus Magasanikbacteria bacterium]
MKDIKGIANFIYEVGMLNRTPRSGFQFLGTGDQSVAEHSFRTAVISYVLGKMDGKVDVGKMIIEALFHDLGEARVSDLSHVHQKYNERHQADAVKDVAASLPFGQDIVESYTEHENRTTPESILVKDADTLEWIISLKEQVDTGNARALTWIEYATKRLQTEVAKNLVAEIMKTDSNEWWGGEKGGVWWK